MNENGSKWWCPGFLYGLNYPRSCLGISWQLLQLYTDQGYGQPPQKGKVHMHHLKTSSVQETHWDSKPYDTGRRIPAAQWAETRGLNSARVPEDSFVFPLCALSHVFCVEVFQFRTTFGFFSPLEIPQIKHFSLLACFVWKEAKCFTAQLFLYFSQNTEEEWKYTPKKVHTLYKIKLFTKVEEHTNRGEIQGFFLLQ